MYIFYLLVIIIAAWNFGISDMYAQNPEWAIYPDMQAVTDLAQEDEFLWITSYGGVAKLNRHTLKSSLLTKANTGLPDHNVLTVNVQTNSKKWFRSTYQGLMLFDNNEWAIFMRDTYPASTVKPVTQGDNIWLRGGTDTLIRYDGQNWQNIDVSGITENTDNIADLYWDGSSLWAGSTCAVKDSFCTALYRLIDGEWSSILLPLDKKILSISPVAHRNNAT